MTESAGEIRQRFFASVADPATLLQLLDFVPGAYLYVKDLEGRFVALNQARVAMSRARSEEELLGKTDLDIHPAYWGERYHCRFDRLIGESIESAFQIALSNVTVSVLAACSRP